MFMRDNKNNDTSYSVLCGLLVGFLGAFFILFFAYFFCDSVLSGW